MCTEKGGGGGERVRETKSGEEDYYRAKMLRDSDWKTYNIGKKSD